MEKPILKETKSSFSLKNIFDKKEEKKEVSERGGEIPQSPFSEKDLLEFWHEFVENLLKSNKIAVYNALHTGKLQLKEEFKIEFEFNSASLASEFELEKDNLMRFLREKLNNHQIEFDINIKHDPSKKYVKTNQEKFMDMAEQNPILLKMKEEFGLDYNSNE